MKVDNKDNGIYTLHYYIRKLYNSQYKKKNEGTQPSNGKLKSLT